MKGWMKALTEMYIAAAAYLCALIGALFALSYLYAAAPWLLALMVLTIVARIVWTRTRW